MKIVIFHWYLWKLEHLKVIMTRTRFHYCKKMQRTMLLLIFSILSSHFYKTHVCKPESDFSYFLCHIITGYPLKMIFKLWNNFIWKKLLKRTSLPDTLSQCHSEWRIPWWFPVLVNQSTPSNYHPSKRSIKKRFLFKKYLIG